MTLDGNGAVQYAVDGLQGRHDGGLAETKNEGSGHIGTQHNSSNHGIKVTSKRFERANISLLCSIDPRARVTHKMGLLTAYDQEASGIHTTSRTCLLDFIYGHKIDVPLWVIGRNERS